MRQNPNESLPDDGGIWAGFDKKPALDAAITAYYSDSPSSVHAAQAP